MTFFEAYKQLDNLCKDIFHSDKGVTSYIEQMEKTGYWSTSINGWKSDFEKLKYYRHLRNRIAHESHVSEEMYCSDTDVQWVENFHQRILQRTDPLALCEEVKRKYNERARETLQNSEVWQKREESQNRETLQAGQVRRIPTVSYRQGQKKEAKSDSTYSVTDAIEIGVAVCVLIGAIIAIGIVVGM